MKRSKALIDWLTLTARQGTIFRDTDSVLFQERKIKHLVVLMLPESGEPAIFEQGMPHYGMSRCLVEKRSGISCHFVRGGGSSPDCVIRCTGDALCYVRTAEGSTQALARRAQAMGLAASRMDVAIDTTASIDSFVECARTSQTGNGARRCTLISPVNREVCDSGTTLYIGRRGSSRFLRIYEKGKQLGLGIEDADWIRIELETKRKVSRELFDVYCKDGILPLVGDIFSRYTFPSEIWESIQHDLMGNVEALRIISSTDGRSSNDAAFLLRCLKAILRGINDLGLEEFLERAMPLAQAMGLQDLATKLDHLSMSLQTVTKRRAEP